MVSINSPSAAGGTTFDGRSRTEFAYQRAEQVAAPFYHQAYQIAARVAERLHSLRQGDSKDSDALIQFASDTTSFGNDKRWLAAYIYLRDRGIVVSQEQLDERRKSYSGIEQAGRLIFGSSKSIPYALNSLIDIGVSAECILFLREKLESIQAISSELGHGRGSAVKVLRLMAGVAWFSADETSDCAYCAENLSPDEVIMRGLLYGMSYPFADDVTDTKTLRDGADHERLRDYIYRSLTERRFEEVEFEGALRPLGRVAPIVQEICQRLSAEYQATYFDVLLALHHAQMLEDHNIQHHNSGELDTIAHLSVKAGLSKHAASVLSGMPFKKTHYDRLFSIGLINQLQDDLGDVVQDLRNGSQTLFTMLLREEGPSTLHPLDLLHAAYLDLQEASDGDIATKMVIVRARQRFGAIKTECESKYPEICEKLLECARETTRHLFEPLMRQAVAGDDLEAKLTSRAGNVVARTVAIKKTLLSAQKEATRIVQKGVEEADAELEKDLLKNPHLINATRYALDLQGKNLRATLTLIVSRLFTGDPQDMQPLMNALEYLQTASLIMDDLPQQDNALLRRGMPSVHIEHGEAEAQLAVIVLLGRAFVSTSRLSEKFGAEKSNAVSAYLGENLQKLSAGQSMDLSLRNDAVGDVNLEIKDLLKVHLGKTGYGIEAAFVSAAILYLPTPDKRTEEDARILKTLSSLGKTLGLLFQVKDDLLERRDIADTGKSIVDRSERSVAMTEFYSPESLAQMLLTLERASYILIAKLPGNLVQKQELMALVDYFVTRTH